MQLEVIWGDTTAKRVYVHTSKYFADRNMILDYIAFQMINPMMTKFNATLHTVFDRFPLRRELCLSAAFGGGGAGQSLLRVLH